jgi:tRNA (cmo5U34)-methyltransferase
VTQYHFDPATYLDMMRDEVPAYERLQDAVASASDGVTGEVARVLDLGTGTGETLAAVLARHGRARALGVDKSPGMLDEARRRLAALDAAGGVELVVADLADPLPEGTFDLVVSALAIHHLDGPAKAELFTRIAAALRPGGRFVLGDVVVPSDPADAVTPLTPEHDQPSRLDEHVDWLRAAGFTAAVAWTERDLAVIAADRPG